MEVQILEFRYNSTSIEEIEEQINLFLDHHNVMDVQVERWENQLHVFFFVDE